MPPPSDDTSRLVLHAVRLLGSGDTARVAARFAIPFDVAAELLLDVQAVGWVTRTEFAGTRAWSLTDAGRTENERLLAAELDACGGRDAVAAAHASFLPLNDAFQRAATDWQCRPLPGDPLAANDHSDVRWDDRVVGEVVSIGHRLRPVCDRLTDALTRFDGYADRYAAAAGRVRRGEHRWVDALGVDSCHVVWMQLHEDLRATLGLGHGPNA